MQYTTKTEYYGMRIMDDKINGNNQLKENPIATPQPQIQETKPKFEEVPEESVAMPKKSIIVFPTVILLVIISIIAGYLLYQNYQLRTQISQLVAQIPTPTAEPTPFATLGPTATPDVTADWKTYTDPKGKYSFKYPTDWTVSKDVGLLNDPTMKFILDLQAKDTTLSAQDWANANVCTKFATPTDQNGCTTYVFGPINNSIQFTFLAHYGAMHTVFKNGNTIFDVTVNAREPNPNFEDIKGVYDQILSTFKFTDNGN